MAGTTNGTVIGALTERAMELRAAPMPSAAADAAELALVDWLGVTLGGSTGVPARALLTGLGPLSGASRLAGGGTAPPPLAALVNGTAAHTLELDDIYAPGLFHPGAPIIAAALAVADQVRASGETLLRAVVTGYEVGCRVATDLGPAHYKHWHTTGTAGSVGAAAAAAEVLGADEDVFAHALALAATMASGLQQTFRSDAMGKPLHAGNAAHAGVVAVALAAGGVTGAADALEGEAGLGAASGAPSRWETCRAPLGSPPAINAVTVKPYPCCGHTFAVIDAVLELRAKGLTADDVDRLDVATYSTALAVAGIARPRTAAERRFSIPHLASLALLDGAVTAAAIESDRKAADLRALAEAVRLEADPVFEERFPSRRGARVTAVTRSGKRMTAEVPDRSGSPQNPLPYERVKQKFLDTAAAVIGTRGPRLLAQVGRLRAGGEVVDLEFAQVSRSLGAP
ncbi:MmgE/PrpD family protein [Actinomadura rugatobispora]|uniref:MmgE/PrpD family protein n=1 Tax=Actinomadura rugatobispora TaxID=1994 RepID=A0ABW0ZX32_9ACTN|nr:MmgE/PrpD family protein [Actinomadura rugatobispora]